jgi:hypothetical protein
VGGGVAALLILLLSLFCLRRRRRRAAHEAYISRDKPDVLDPEEVVDPAFQPQPFVVPALAPSVHSIPSLPAPGGPLSALRSPTTTRGSSDHYRYDALATDPDSVSSRANLVLPPGAMALSPTSEAGESSASARSPKSAMRQAALERQLWEVQRRIDALPPSDTSGSSSGGGPSVYAPTSAGGGEGEEGAAVLRAQVEALKAEVDRLRAENAGVGFYGAEAPPAYDGSRREEGGAGTIAGVSAAPQGKAAWLVAQNLSAGDAEH